MENKSFVGVLLAGGRGSRLGEAAQGKNKALLQIGGRPLCYFALDFLKNVGAEKILVLGGHDTEELRNVVSAYDKDIEVLEGDKRGSLYSLLLALPHIDNSFLLANADHIYRKPIAEKVRAQLKGVTAFCDFDRKLGDDDMKIWHNNFHLAKISKKLDEFNGGYVGLTYYSNESLPHVKSILSELAAGFSNPAVVEDGLRQMMERGHKVNIGDISGIGWLEIDFPEELARAKQIITEEKHDFF